VLSIVYARIARNENETREDLQLRKRLDSSVHVYIWRGYINTLKIEPTLSFEFFVVAS
jgi:hypothetical protein